MLKIVDKEYFAKVCEFAAKKGLAEELFERLLYLHTYGDHELTGRMQVELYHDRTPASFDVSWARLDPGSIGRASQGYVFCMNGGLIYHGDQTGWVNRDGSVIGETSGSFNTLAVRLTDESNHWSIHT